MHLAITELFHARWTEAIHDEWIRNLLNDRPDLRPEQLQRTRELMNANVLDCVVKSYEPLVEGLTLPDPNDRHVLAAAIHASVDIIVTLNLKDFPEQSLRPFHIEAQHPDQFVASQFDLAPHIVCLAAQRHRMSLRNPPKDVEEYLATLEAQQLPMTVARLTRHSELIGRDA